MTFRRVCLKWFDVTLLMTVPLSPMDAMIVEQDWKQAWPKSKNYNVTNFLVVDKDNDGEDA